MSSTDTVPDHNKGRPRRITFAVWRSPLARPADRLQAATLLIAFGLWLIGLPGAAVAGSLIWSDISVTAQEQQQTRTMTSAWLLNEASLSAEQGMIFAEHGVPATDVVPVAARWTAADGSPRTGTIKTTSGRWAGDQVTIWIDKSGAVTDPPTSSPAAAALTVLAAMGIWLAWGVLLLALWLGLRHRLDKQRRAEWDRRWERVEPLWTGR